MSASKPSRTTTSIIGLFFKLKNSESCTATTGIAMDFIVSSSTGPFGQYLAQRFKSTYTVRQVRWALTGMAPIAERLFNQTILKGMKTYHREA